MKLYLPYLAGLGVALAWGFSFLFTRGALDQLEPFHLLGLRFAAALAAFALLRFVGVINFKVYRADYLKLLPLALFQPIFYFSCETVGIMLTSASYGGMMIAAIPIFVAILSALVLGEKPGQLQLLFILASVAGVIFIIIMDNNAISRVNPLGTAALLGAVTAAAFYNIASRKASSAYAPLQITWIMIVAGAVVFNLIALGRLLAAGSAASYLAPLANLWPTVIYLGVVSSVGAFFLYNFVLSRVTATQASVFINLITVVAIAAGVIFRSETVFWYHLAGTSAILLGVWGTNRFAPPLHQYESETEKVTDTG